MILKSLRFLLMNLLSSLLALQPLPLSSILKTEATVIIISLGFSKAFNTVKHSTLVQKLSRLDFPDNIYNWMVDFLLDRKHRTRYAGQVSVDVAINASVVQGSGLALDSTIDLCTDIHIITYVAPSPSLWGVVPHL